MNEFRVVERDNCVIVYGALSPAGIKGICGMAHKKANISPQLARMLGANWAFGLQTDVDALIAKITPQAEADVDRTASTLGISTAAARWLASGERGNSSETMFTHLTGVDANSGSKRAVPCDPSDLRRCLLLLDQCPELLPRLPTMADVSPEWAGLIHNWDNIIATMREEVGDILNPKRGALAPRTYKLIKLATGR